MTHADPQKVVTEDEGCPLGCERADEYVLSGSDILSDLPGLFTVVRCRACGLARTNPRPDRATIALHYPDAYGPFVGTRAAAPSPQSRTDLRVRVRGWVERSCPLNEEVVPNLQPGELIEIGCASGAFLQKMRSDGWSVTGIEPSKSAGDYARSLGHSVHFGDIESSPAPDRPADLIVGWMVLEHLHNPIGSLRILRDRVQPDGWLVLSVPNAGSLEFNIFGKRWYALQLPTHLYHFDVRSLSKTLAAGGWKVERIYHQRILSNLVGSLGYLARDAGLRRIGEKLIAFPNRPGVWTYVLFPLAVLFAALGQTGRMTVWAKPA